jgi:UDP:flavonoid glycosyltransferase YjiC (YdhE family)
MRKGRSSEESGPAGLGDMARPGVERPGQFLFAMFQGSGNIPPILAVVQRLAARGHQVRVIAGPGLTPDRPGRPASPAFLDSIREAGATVIPLPAAEDPFAAAPPVQGGLWGWTPPSFAVNVFVARRFLAAPVWADHVRGALLCQPADVVAADFFLLGALAAAETMGVPAAALVHHHHIRPMRGLPPFGPGWLPARSPMGWLRDALGKALVARIHRRDGLPPLNHARRQLGLPSLRSPLEQYDTAARVLIMTSPAFDFRPRAVPPNVRYVGMPFEEAGAVPWESPWPAADTRPLVLVSFSTAPQGQVAVLRRTLKALAALPVRALVTLGPALPRNQFQAPDHVVLTPFVPHALVLPHAALMVSQCGHGSVMKALAFGVPLVCLPLVGDQPGVAARVVHAGVGVRLRPEASSQQIQDAIQQLLTEPRFREAARRLAQAMATEDGVQTAALTT